MALPLAFISPCWLCFVPLCSLFNPLLLTWNPPSCDRIRPPRSQVACKLTSPVPTLSPTSPLQIPRTPITQRLTKTSSGTIRRLLSGTIPSCTARLISALSNHFTYNITKNNLKIPLKVKTPFLLYYRNTGFFFLPRIVHSRMILGLIVLGLVALGLVDLWYFSDWSFHELVILALVVLGLKF